MSAGRPSAALLLYPERFAELSSGMPLGLGNGFFARAEWPEHWSGVHAAAKPLPIWGCCLRLEASLFELELYHQLHPSEVKRTVSIFEEEVASLVEKLGARRLIATGTSEQRSLHDLPLGNPDAGDD